MILYNKSYNKSSFCKIQLLLPEYKRTKDVYNIYGDSINCTKLSLPTHFLLNSNKVYVSINISILGFGILLQVHE